MTLNKDFPNDEQLIVNQRCNLIIHYLERQSKEKSRIETEKVIILAVSENETTRNLRLLGLFVTCSHNISFGVFKNRSTLII